ncbi:EVE domain-containing protein, partial [archaeon SCG-AAA382B04]
EDVLELVGKLENSTEEESAADRFRNYLSKNADSVGILKEYVEECLEKSGSQYNRALQDVVNHIGRLLGFEVKFGRYQGVSTEIGFDGFWISPKGGSIVVETKTTDTYSVDTSTLLNYRNKLVSEGRIENKEDSIGLYVVGESKYEQIENDIIANKREKEIRVISIDALLNLLEIKEDYE